MGSILRGARKTKDHRSRGLLIPWMFKDHHMSQLFTRPRTLNDSPFVESLFAATKTAPQYPKRILDLDHRIQYFDRYFLCNNRENYHSGIDYVTPEQCHQGSPRTQSQNCRSPEPKS